MPDIASPSGLAPTVLGRRRDAAREIARDLWRDKTGLFGLFVIAGLIVVGVFGPLFSPHDPSIINLGNRLKPPMWLDGGSAAFALGTDHLGRDVLSRIIHGARVSLLVGAATVAMAGAIGCGLGLFAGYLGGKVDAAVTGFADMQVAFPGLLLALVILAMIGPRVETLIVVLTINGWMVFARLTRALTLSLRKTAFVEGAVIVGCGPGRVVVRHLLPNLASPIITLVVLEFARIVLAEAALSFLGMGVQPPAASWGLDITIGKTYIFRAWWLVTFPGLAITVTVLGVNLFASWLRLFADPFERDKLFAQSQSAGGAGQGS